MRIVVFIATMLCLQLAHAQAVYRCAGSAGPVFQQQPCDGNLSGRIQVRAINTIEGEPYGDAGIRAEAERSARVEAATARGEVVDGMTEAELQAVLGVPSAVNSRMVDGRVDRQYVYRGSAAVQTVYTRGGEVVSSSVREYSGRGDRRHHDRWHRR